MKGATVPLILLPRYTSYVGTSGYFFTTVPMDVTEYEGGTFYLWRGKALGGSPAVWVWVEESTDAETWTLVGSAPAKIVTVEDNRQRVDLAFQKKWFRLRIELQGTDVAVSCWAIGTLTTRVS